MVICPFDFAELYFSLWRFRTTCSSSKHPRAQIGGMGQKNQFVCVAGLHTNSAKAFLFTQRDGLVVFRFIRENTATKLHALIANLHRRTGDKPPHLVLSLCAEGTARFGFLIRKLRDLLLPAVAVGFLKRLF